MAALTTICVSGFPGDVSTREFKNFCRFLPGFEDAQVTKNLTFFVKFQTARHAQTAVQTLNGAPFDVDNPVLVLTAAVAKRELASALTTITVLGVTAKGLEQEKLSAWFRRRPGFAKLQVNERIDAVFVKFDTPEAAEQAVHDANVEELGAEWARRNLDDDRTDVAQSAEIAHTAQSRTASGEVLSTIAVLGVKGRGFEQSDLSVWFQGRPGYLKLQVNDRIDAIFVKFDTSETADRAIQDAQAEGVSAEWARRNLDDERLAAVGVRTHEVAGWTDGEGLDRSVRQRVDGDLDTIAFLGIQASGYRQADIISWISQRPGYVTQKSNGRIDGAFAKFASRALAARALHDANAQGLCAEWARRNLDAELDTITVLSMRSKGLQRAELQEWFVRRPGFLGLKLNDKIDSMFIKFVSTVAADRAIHDAVAEGISAEWARRNLDDPDQVPGRVGNPDFLDTIAILGITAKGRNPEEVQRWLEQSAGFVKLKMNAKVDGIFAKFASAAEAEQVIRGGVGYGAEWAHRNLD